MTTSTIREAISTAFDDAPAEQHLTINADSGTVEYETVTLALRGVSIYAESAVIAKTTNRSSLTLIALTLATPPPMACMPGRELARGMPKLLTTTLTAQKVYVNVGAQKRQQTIDEELVDRETRNVANELCAAADGNKRLSSTTIAMRHAVDDALRRENRAETFDGMIDRDNYYDSSHRLIEAFRRVAAKLKCFDCVLKNNAIDASAIDASASIALTKEVWRQIVDVYALAWRVVDKTRDVNIKYDRNKFLANFASVVTDEIEQTYAAFINANGGWATFDRLYDVDDDDDDTAVSSAVVKPSPVISTRTVSDELCVAANDVYRRLLPTTIAMSHAVDNVWRRHGETFDDSTIDFADYDNRAQRIYHAFRCAAAKLNRFDDDDKIFTAVDCDASYVKEIWRQIVGVYALAWHVVDKTRDAKWTNWRSNRTTFVTDFVSIVVDEIQLTYGAWIASNGGWATFDRLYGSLRRIK